MVDEPRNRLQLGSAAFRKLNSVLANKALFNTATFCGLYKVQATLQVINSKTGGRPI